MIPRVVICNGGWRTGSTVVFNIAREILRLFGVEHESGLRAHPADVDADLERFAQQPFWAVLKCHVWAPMAARSLADVRVIYTQRDPIDVAASLVRFRHDHDWAEVVAEVQRQALLDAYHARPDIVRIARPLCVSYERFYARPVARVELVARHIGIELSAEQAVHVAERTGIAAALRVQRDVEPGMQDDATLIQSGHIGEERGEPGWGEAALGSERAASVRLAIHLLGLDRPVGELSYA